MKKRIALLLVVLSVLFCGAVAQVKIDKSDLHAKKNAFNDENNIEMAIAKYIIALSNKSLKATKHTTGDLSIVNKTDGLKSRLNGDLVSILGYPRETKLLTKSEAKIVFSLGNANVIFAMVNKKDLWLISNIELVENRKTTSQQPRGLVNDVK